MKKILEYKKYLYLFVITMVSVFSFTSVLAFFVDSNQNNMIANTQTFDINCVDFTLSNPNTLVPGDNDLSLNQENRRKGDEHKLSFQLQNLGNKAARLRALITIDVKDKKMSTLDPTVFFLLDNNVELENKYLLVDGKWIEETQYNSGDITQVKYEVIFNVLDGTGENAEIENKEPKSVENYSYDFGFKSHANDQYQGANLTINMQVQAMQYKNTTNSAWTTLFDESIDIKLNN